MTRATRHASRHRLPTRVRPHTAAGTASTSRPRHPLRPRIPSAVLPNRISNLTPGITRRPERFELHDKQRVGGRVHAVVRSRADLSQALDNIN
jgi:hypothetical protein